MRYTMRCTVFILLAECCAHGQVLYDIDPDVPDVAGVVLLQDEAPEVFLENQRGRCQFSSASGRPDFARVSWGVR